MKSTSEIREILRSQKSELRRLQVSSLSVFGSTAHGENTDESDIDFLVEFSQPVGLFDYLELKYFLEAILKAEIDLVTKGGLDPQLRDQFLLEAIPVV